MRVTDAAFVKAWVAGETLEGIAKQLDLPTTTVVSRAATLRRLGVKLPPLQRGRRVRSHEEVVQLNTLVATAQHEEAGLSAPSGGAGIFWPAGKPAPAAQHQLLDAVIAWWIPARTGIELDATELTGELGSMDKPPPRQYLAPWELGKSLRSIITDLVPAGIVVTSRVVSGKTLWKFEAGPVLAPVNP